MAPGVTLTAKFLAFLTLVTDAGIAVFLVTAVLALFIPAIRTIRHSAIIAVSPHTRILALTVALTATLGSLFYSEIAGFTPCILCWYQRILMYPQTVIIAMGIFKKDRHAADYSIALSVIGAAIAAYHYFIQIGGTAIVPCSTVGFSSACSDRFSLEYGYITIPMMSLSAFIAIILLMLISKVRRKDH